MSLCDDAVMLPEQRRAATGSLADFELVQAGGPFGQQVGSVAKYTPGLVWLEVTADGAGSITLRSAAADVTGFTYRFTADRALRIGPYSRHDWGLTGPTNGGRLDASVVAVGVNWTARWVGALEP